MVSIIFGLIIGFIIGLALIKIFLRGKSKQELRTNKDLHSKYGTLVWLIALLGGALGYAINLSFFSL